MVAPDDDLSLLRSPGSDPSCGSQISNLLTMPRPNISRNLGGICGK